MLGFVAPRLVLLSVPKTGTTALEKALASEAELVLRSRPEIKHLTLRQYQWRIAPLLAPIPGDPFRTIAVVREPMSWLGSWFRYRQRPQLAGRPNSTAGLTFEAFVRDLLSPDPPPYARLGRQAGFLAPAPDHDGPDLLFQYEQLDLLVAFLETALNTSLTLTRTNQSPKADMTLEPGTQAALRAALAEDYALWESAARPGP